MLRSTVIAPTNTALPLRAFLEQRGAGRGARYVGTPRLMLAVAAAADIAAERIPTSGSLEKQRDAVLAAIAGRIHVPVPSSSS